MLPFTKSFVVLLVASFFVFPTAVQAEKDDPTTSSAPKNFGQIQVEWLRSKGGYVSEGLAFSVTPEEPLLPTGLYATKDLLANETLILVPQPALFTSRTGNRHAWCRTASRLVQHYQMGDQSEFAPYVQYIMSRPPGHLPSGWSVPAKGVMHQIQGKQFYPEFITSMHGYRNNCGNTGGGEADGLLERAYTLVVSRAWDDKFVPVLDMFNHRNGKYTNVDSDSIHTGADEMRVYTTRAVQKGESLHLSYNECTDCQDLKYTYATPEILGDFGFVEDYPQRWRFPAGHVDNPIMFDLEQVDNSEQLNVTWISLQPTVLQVNYLRGHLKRLDLLNRNVQAILPLIPPQEQDLLLTYYNALRTALQEAIWDTEVDEAGLSPTCLQDPTQCSVEMVDNQPTVANRSYDALVTWNDVLPYEDFSFSHELGYGLIFSDYNAIETVESFYQKMDFFRDPTNDDFCMALSNFLQTCHSFRSHYHEILIHYAARYVNQVKRVLYIGGGDGMVLHEIMKYPDLELVVGLELDHVVVRKAFQYFGTQPFWNYHKGDQKNHPKVEWWFGNAAESLRLLPESYFGSFDLILLDLETSIVKKVKVSGEKTIIDVVLLLIGPDGVIARNDDDVSGVREPFADYFLELEYQDVPILNFQSVVLGSNSVDFSKKELTEHGVETLFLKSVEEKDHFHFWYDYTKRSVDKTNICSKKEAIQPPPPDGVLMILEAEEAKILEPAAEVEPKLIKLLVKLGLTPVKNELAEFEETDDYVLISILQEGYVAMQRSREEEYVAIDIMLWNQVDKQDEIASSLLQLVGSSESSAYRIVTGGMFGATEERVSFNNLQPSTPGLCDDFEVASTNSNDSLTSRQNFSNETLIMVYQRSLSLLPEVGSTKAPVVVVLCGVEDCVALDSIQSMSREYTVIPIYPCKSKEENTGSSMPECESRLVAQMEEALGSTKTVHGVLVDVYADKSAAQLLLKVLANGSNRRKFLSDNITVVSIGDNEWQLIFLERFRTDLFVYDPAYRADVTLKDSDDDQTMELLCIFVAGNAHFYRDLLQWMKDISDSMTIATVLEHSKNGMLNHDADFDASFFPTEKNFDRENAVAQFSTQEPLFDQVLIQLELMSGYSRLEAGDAVLIIRKKNSPIAAHVVQRRPGGIYVVVYDDTQERHYNVVRKRMKPIGKPNLRPVIPPSPIMMEQALTEALDTELRVNRYDVGAGFILAGMNPDETVILIWDGEFRITIHVWTALLGKDKDSTADFLVKELSQLIEPSGSHVKVAARDVFPRGSHRTVNSVDDIKRHHANLKDDRNGEASNEKYHLELLRQQAQIEQQHQEL